MKAEEESKDTLQSMFEELTQKYQNAIHEDLHFEEVKKIYDQLQEIKLKLAELNKKIANAGRL